MWRSRPKVPHHGQLTTNDCLQLSAGTVCWYLHGVSACWAYERQTGNWILLPDFLAVAVSMLVEVDEI